MQQANYAIDLVLCIDKSESMHAMLDWLKANCSRLAADLTEKHDRCRRRIAKLRVKVIAFGNMYGDQNNWITVSEFFPLPEQ
jgi:hypothetical protein